MKAVTDAVMKCSEVPLHGGDLLAAALRYRIPLSDWLDLSTGINPRAYPIGSVEPALFHHLPRATTALAQAATNYCGAPGLPVLAPGSQALIQWLPELRNRRCGRSRVAVPSIGYREHAFRWQWSGHELLPYDARESDAIDRLLMRDCPDVLVVINPHNPLGTVTGIEQLLVWRERLAQRGGWLIVDEAFIDATPELSVIAHTQLPGLIVLRSLGKFFGLAGMRLGYAFADTTFCEQLTIAVGPWALTGPTQYIADIALRDADWQRDMRAQLAAIGAANVEVLNAAPWRGAATVHRTALFNSMLLPITLAEAVHANFARAGILVRLIAVDDESSILRFGLVDTERRKQWERFRAASAAPIA